MSDVSVSERQIKMGMSHEYAVSASTPHLHQCRDMGRAEKAGAPARPHRSPSRAAASRGSFDRSPARGTGAIAQDTSLNADKAPVGTGHWSLLQMLVFASIATSPGTAYGGEALYPLHMA